MEVIVPDDVIVEVDGAYSHLDDKAACGGVLKDGSNCMKEAFLLKLSGGDTLTAKLWGCLMGLKGAWDAGTGDVILRSDSAEAVRLIKFEVPEMHKDIALIMEIKGMLEGIGLWISTSFIEMATDITRTEVEKDGGYTQCSRHQGQFVVEEDESILPRFQILAMAHDADGDGGSSSSSASTKRWKYHVFLSFRGEDTRTSFTDHLYTALKCKGLKTFRDEEELERGESITPSLIQAIEESLSAIVVLSPSYASSTWCLDELQMILHLKEELSLQVFPIFYGVDPSDVRKQKGSFAEAFMKHEERFAQDITKVQRWRDALGKVATTSGWDSKNQYETKFIESIAKEMMTNLLDESPSDLRMLIGIESKLGELESIVARKSQGDGFIGIWGTGGLGKTTLARAFYERKLKDFEIHCFLHNIREAYEKDGLMSLQRRLLFSIDKRSMEVDNFYEGMKLIKNMLGNKKFLLVLDDVSDVSQLENLAPKQGWFSKGSIILITTRDKHLLSSHGVSSMYDIKFLNDNESLKLFLQKAFKGEQPNEDYLDLARTIIKYAGGLPLALKVLGSFLCKRTIMEWKDALAKFKKAPPKDILKILQVSFDGLDIKEKTIFLDIACFFNGMAQDHVIQILETLDENLHPRIGITVLIEKSLVIDYEGYLWVHEILQDMGKFIAYQQSPDDAGKRSRILSLEDANHLNLPYGLKTLSSELKIIEWERIPGCSKLSKLPENLNENEALEELDLSKIAVKGMAEVMRFKELQADVTGMNEHVKHNEIAINMKIE
ncbi:TMV resistance protein N-like [Neltuma alba]|uniref:TMV resistance protein N-like n=1 Tax=Neltuma alba TaxID=207710 RepID=UPI0010A45C50|nr:TMV resistance protein N-like [Prosopis alba]